MFWQTFWMDEENHEELDQQITEAQQAASDTVTQKMEGNRFQQAMKNYSDKKSRGADHWSPAESKALPVQAADKLAEVLNDGQRMATWPVQPMVILMPLLGKPDGG